MTEAENKGSGSVEGPGPGGQGEGSSAAIPPVEVGGRARALDRGYGAEISPVSRKVTVETSLWVHTPEEVSPTTAS